MLNQIQIKDKFIGNNAPCFIVAEIGINHNGDMQLAKETILAAKQAGADAVKFQNYETEDFILDKNLTYEYISNGKKVVETQYEMFKRYELSFEQLEELKKYADEVGIIFFSTPTSLRGIQDLERLEVPLLKNGSDFLVNLEIIAQMAKTGIPTVISTGMATLAEIDEAVRAFEQAGGKKLIILHCISSYPTPPEEVNLLKIRSLQSAFNYPVGFSDHTEGVVAAIGAVALGACFIEKHFTIDNNLEGPDHRFSSNPKEFRELVEAIRFLEKAMGSSKIAPTQKEEFGRLNFRLSCVAKRNLSKGETIKKEDVAFSRPATGIPPKFVEFLIGKKLLKDVKAGEPFQFNILTL
ncbi:MAG: N-acetylneuraminate synthase family protein [Bacteroidia bacterium]|nr:N-acetylneuraminate synthase family protein [Bacteroidia bacterium]MDW8301670.1 N-acetylneuraminate synthase family protein [Bacteroidia bacterium]